MPHATRPRIAPLPLGELAPDQQRLARLGADTVIQVLAKNPPLMQAASGLGAYLLGQGELPPRLRELVILRVALRCDAAYEWANHVPAAFGAGATANEINGLSDPAAAWAPAEDAALRAADELCADAFVSDATWATLAASFAEPALLELLFLIGYYRLMAGFLNSAGVAVEPDRPVLGEPVAPPAAPAPVVAPPSSGRSGLDGTWHITFTHPAGSKELVLRLTTSGTTLNGSIVDRQLGVTVPLTSGTVEGDRVEFEAEVTEPARFRVGVTGVVEGDVFTGSVTVSGGGTFPFSGTRAG
ncbi:MAG TPA: carboxymuconolactone decarboxylase family protein [Amycolatopsis sp.]|nr:carboxymuconolactone decarboxylase family protein [Amycolatopsis sp.]